MPISPCHLYLAMPCSRPLPCFRSFCCYPPLLSTPPPDFGDGHLLRELLQGVAEGFRAALGVLAAFAGWSKRRGVALHGVPRLERVIDVVDCAFASRIAVAPPTTSTQELIKGLWCNAAQGVGRSPWGDPGTLTCKSLWYNFSEDQALDGVDYLRLQGLPKTCDITGLSNSELKDLAGEGYSCPVITSFLVACYYQPWAGWWREAAP